MIPYEQLAAVLEGNTHAAPVVASIKSHGAEDMTLAGEDDSNAELEIGELPLDEEIG